ncbi:chemotaxis protein CheB [Helicobacter muridarum]|uniref:protein-glutamate methylesterase n=1 Tax=Helicobacter muridarum TaxID=216 RepID=A0A377PUI3_9HELI|nr:CheB methylesterase domain-containing protein [Helicobacter muridarum]TLE01620.1 chemotaxis protein CheB [Helicobacter muridarum]STQ86237.1 chemotaxis protein methylesterase CheB [Helicobacter muridarum]
MLPKSIILSNQVEEKYHPDTVLPKKPSQQARDKVIVIGSSTGGTEALYQIFSALPTGLPPIVVVQHIPKTFSSSLANRLNANSKLSICEVNNLMELKQDWAYIANGDSHAVFKYEGRKCYVMPLNAQKISRHRPSVDVLFRSANNVIGRSTLAIILTGMGDDGSIGMKELFDNGAYTIAQDESSCIVFGMPKKAIEAGAIKEVLPLSKIPNRIVDYANGKILSSHKDIEI